MSFWPASSACEFWSPSCMAAPQALHERRAIRAEAVEAARADQRLEHAAIELLQIEPPAQVLETRERPVRFALGDERLDRALPHAAHRAEAVADRAIVIDA